MLSFLAYACFPQCHACWCCVPIVEATIACDSLFHENDNYVPPYLPSSIILRFSHWTLIEGYRFAIYYFKFF